MRKPKKQLPLKNKKSTPKNTKQPAFVKASPKELTPKKPTQFLQSEDAPIEVAAVLKELLRGLAHGDPGVISELLHGIVGSASAKADPVAMEPVVSFNTSLQALKRLVEPGQSRKDAMLLPEAVEKLDQILSRAGKATEKLLGLLNQQEEILAHAERLILDLEEHLKRGAISQETLERELLECRVLNATIKKISSDMLFTQDIEDLCGFVIPKIKTLLASVESDIRTHLHQVGIDVVDANALTQSELTDQWRIDQILEEFSR